MGAEFCPLKRQINEKLRVEARSFAIVKSSPKSSFRSRLGKHGGFAGFGISTVTLVCGRAAARLATRTVAGVAATRLTLAPGFRLALGGCGCGFRRHVLDHGLRTRAGDFHHRLGLMFTRLARFTRFALTALMLLLAIMLLRLLGRLLRTLAGLDDGVVRTVEILAVPIIIILAIIATIAVVALEALLHLRLGGCDDAVVVLGVLQIVFRHDTVAGTLRIARQRRILLGNMLGRATDLHVWAGAVIGPGQRVLALAVEIVSTAAATAAIVVTPPTTLVLLSWPHRCFT
jgi:hypothetical protein